MLLFSALAVFAAATAQTPVEDLETIEGQEIEIVFEEEDAEDASSEIVDAEVAQNDEELLMGGVEDDLEQQ